MAKDILKEIEELQRENKRLLEYEKLFKKALKITFDSDEKTIKKALNEYHDKVR